MTLAIALVVAAALIAFGAGGVLLRRSLVGALVGAQLAAGGVVLAAVARFDLAGSNASLGQVFAVAVIVLTVAVAVAALAVHLAGARAGSTSKDRLEPW